MNELESIFKLYRHHPEMFTNEEVNRLMEIAKMAGFKFQPKTTLGREIGAGVMNLLDAATFGAIPNTFKPTPRTLGGRIGATAGTIAGAFTTPLAAGRALGMRATGGLARLGGVRFTKKGVGEFITQKGAGVTEAIRSLPGVGQRLAPLAEKGVTSLKKLATTKGSMRALKAMGRFGESPRLQGFAERAMLGAGVMAGPTLLSDLSAGDIDKVVTNVMGGVTMGAIGEFIAGLPASKRLLSARNISRVIAVNAAQSGYDFDPEDVTAMIMQLALTRGVGGSFLGPDVVMR